MRFLIKMAFWLGVVMFLLPSENERSARHSGAATTNSAASTALGDVTAFCTRHTNACAGASQAAASLGAKAQEGAKALYGYLGDKLGVDETGSVPSKSDGKASGRREKVSQNTLTRTDLTAVWRGPDQRKEILAARPN